MFIPEREIWLKATAQAMVDLTVVRNTMHGPIHLPADFFLLSCFHTYGFT